MNGRIVRMDVPAHQAVQELLPWYATSQLAPDETRKVHEHLQTCAQCRRDLEWEHGVRAEASATAADMPEGVDMERALARMLPALGPQERSEAADDAPPPPSRPRGWRSAAANQPSWLRWAVAAQWLLIFGLAALLARPDAAPDAYRALGSGTAANGNLVVIFQPNTSESELRRILQTQNARVVDGPTITDAYVLHVPAASRTRALQALRAEAAVKLAEPLYQDSTP